MSNRLIMEPAADGSPANMAPKRRGRHSYNESVDEPAKLIEDEPVEVEEERPQEENRSVEKGDEDKKVEPPAFEE